MSGIRRFAVGNLCPMFARFSTVAGESGNIPPGIGASPDKMLQARLLSYPDAHRYRIGINYAALPINKSRSRIASRSVAPPVI